MTIHPRAHPARSPPAPVPPRPHVHTLVPALASRPQVPFLTQSFSADPSTATLYAFYFGTMGMISFYGGLFSVLPAYLADIFGAKHVGAIHGRTLTAWSAAAVLGIPPAASHPRPLFPLSLGQPSSASRLIITPHVAR